MAAEWVTITEASLELRTTPSKISKLVKKWKIPTRKNPLDERETLVKFEELQKLFSTGQR